LRGRPAVAAIAHEQGVNAEDLFIFPRQMPHRIILASHNAPHAGEGQTAGQHLSAREVQDLPSAYRATAQEINDSQQDDRTKQ